MKIHAARFLLVVSPVAYDTKHAPERLSKETGYTRFSPGDPTIQVVFYHMLLKSNPYFGFAPMNTANPSQPTIRLNTANQHKSAVDSPGQ